MNCVIGMLSFKSLIIHMLKPQKKEKKITAEGRRGNEKRCRCTRVFEHGRPSDLTRANEHGETADCKSNQTFQNFTTETTKFTKCGLRGSPCQRPQPPWPGAPPRRHWRDMRALAQVTSSGVVPSTIRSCSQWSVAPATMSLIKNRSPGPTDTSYKNPQL